MIQAEHRPRKRNLGDLSPAPPPRARRSQSVGVRVAPNTARPPVSSLGPLLALTSTRVAAGAVIDPAEGCRGEGSHWVTVWRLAEEPPGTGQTLGCGRRRDVTPNVSPTCSPLILLLPLPSPSLTKPLLCHQVFLLFPFPFLH